MDHFGYTPRSLEERLGAGGRAALEEVRKRERALRQAVRRLFEIVELAKVPPNKQMQVPPNKQMQQMQRTKPAQATEPRR